MQLIGECAGAVCTRLNHRYFEQLWELKSPRGARIVRRYGAGENAMRDRSRYVFGAALAGVALSGIPALLEHAQGATVGQFTFEGFTSAGSTTGAGFGSYTADSGVGTAFGVHATATSVWSSPAGNGSVRSLSANGWSSGDYYEFDVPTTTFNNLIVSFDQLSSGTGPHAFTFLYSTNGTNFSSFATYLVASSVTTNSTGSTGTVGWNTSSSQALFNVMFDLSALTGLNNDPNAKFRVQAAESGVSTGTDRIDNFTVVGSVPEPASVSLMTAAAAGLLLRRRRGE